MTIILAVPGEQRARARWISGLPEAPLPHAVTVPGTVLLESALL
jgi:hypothetical protein